MRRFALVSLFAVACTKSGGEEPPAQVEVAKAEPEPARAEPEPAKAEPEALAKAEPEPEPADDPVLAKLGDAEAAYYADCSHSFEIPADDYEEDSTIDECAYVPSDQNCAPDPSGCWDEGQQCISACASSCTDCDETCTTGCSGCKAKCKGDDAECKAACAVERAACHQTCMSTKETCAKKECPAEEERCDKAYDKLLARKCPKCEAIRSCHEDASNAGIEDPEAHCGKKFKREPAECLELCSDWVYQ